LKIKELIEKYDKEQIRKLFEDINLITDEIGVTLIKKAAKNNLKSDC
jgi:hypothetical protein